MRNWSEYVWLVNHLIDTGFINTIREIWWDVRPHHNFGTVEVRVCDMPGNLEDVLGLSAFIQCLVQALSDQIDEGAYQHDCHPMIVRQNKWRACRFGNQAKLVNSYTYEVQSVADLIRNLVDKLRKVSKTLGCDHQLDHVIKMVDQPSWSDQQRTIWIETGDAGKVVQRLVNQARVSPAPLARQSDSA
jgi:carboxylate-amine ligase